MEVVKGLEIEVSMMMEEKKLRRRVTGDEGDDAGMLMK